MVAGSLAFTPRMSVETIWGDTTCIRYVESSYQGSQGQSRRKAGLRKDDVILRIDGENVTSVRKLNRLVSEIAPDQTVEL